MPRSTQQAAAVRLLLLLLLLFGCTILTIDTTTTTTSASGRIVGGQTARPAQFPHQASVRDAAAPPARHFCGGSIIHQRWILTAAHCVVSMPASRLAVAVGAHRLHGDGRVYAVGEVHVHGEHNATTAANDIALLRTVDRIEFNERVQAISIGAASDHVGPGIGARASGWGRIESGLLGAEPELLQYVDLVTLTNSDCRARHTDAYQQYVHEESTLCAYSNGAERGMCHGDSGGPLVSDDGGVLLGVVSWGMPCARGKPDGFVRVSSFVPWILERIERDEEVE